MADTPKDLDLVPQTSPDKNYFNVSVKNLKINKTYAIQFQWIYEDGQTSQWSPSYIFITSNELAPSVPSGSVPSTATGSIPVTLASFPAKAKRVDVYVIGGIFGIGKIAYSFSTAGTATIAAPAGSYTVEMRSVTAAGITSTVGETFSITIADVGETIQAPTNPNGFTSKRILAGIEVSWAGTYASSTFTGFEAINIYAGNSATATSGTYEQVGVLTGNNVKNTIIIPLGTYVAYGQAVYIHAAAVNKNGTVGTIQSNVTNQALGPGKATDADINDGAVVISKLASDVLTVGNLKAGDINSTSYIRAGTKASNGLSGARVEISSSTITQTGTNVLPGFYIYNSSGTPILSAPLSGGLSIVGGGTFTGSISGASGQFDGNFTVRSGIVSALAGSIGGWVINSQALKNSAISFPNIMLDPSNAKIELRQTASNISDTGNYIKMDTVNGLRIGSGASPSFSVAMDGQASFQKTVGGNTITLDNSSLRAVGSVGSTILGYDGTITANQYGSWPFSGASIKVSSSDTYSIINPGGVTLHQDSIFGGAVFDFSQFIYNNTLNYYVTGGGVSWANYYVTAGVSTYTTAQIYTALSGGNHDFRPLGLSPDGGQWTGPRLYYGSSTTSSAINSELSGGYGGSSQNGDFYFSTA